MSPRRPRRLRASRSDTGRGVLLRSGLLLEQWPRRISSPSRRCYVTCPRRVTVDFEAPFDEPHEFEPRGPAETDVFPEAIVNVKLRLESFSGGIRVRGPVEAPGTECAGAVRRRCLGITDVGVNERFVDNPDESDELRLTRSSTASSTSPRWCTTRSCWTSRSRRCVARTARDCAPSAASTATKRAVTARRHVILGGLHWTDSDSRTPSPRDPK